METRPADTRAVNARPAETRPADARAVDARAGDSQVDTRAVVSNHICYTVQDPIQTHAMGARR